MRDRQRATIATMVGVLVLALVPSIAESADHAGRVTFSGTPVPGVVVVAAQGSREVRTTTGEDGTYRLPGLADGAWTISVEMVGFARQSRQLDAGALGAPLEWALSLLSIADLNAALAGTRPAPDTTAPLAITPERAATGTTPTAGPPPNAVTPTVAAPTSATPTTAAPTAATTGAPTTGAPSVTAPTGAPTAATPTGTTPTTAAPTAAAPAAPPSAAAPGSARAATTPVGPTAERTDEAASAVVDGLLVDGSVNNAAASPFAQPAAFGNNRPRTGAVYSGSVALHLGSSALDAHPFSSSSARRSDTSYQDARVIATFGGPLRVPGLANKPALFIGYQMLQDHQARTRSAIVPTLLERAGDFSQSVGLSGRSISIRDPLTQQLFPGATIPRNRLSPQALALLTHYPAPNLDDGPFNYEGTELAGVGQHHFQMRLTHRINPRNQLGGNVVLQRDDSDTTSLFAFDDRARRSGAEVTLDWTHRLTQQTATRLRYQIGYQSARLLPYFADRLDVAGQAGIAGVSRAPVDWGPPSLIFSSGVESLDDSVPRRDRTTTQTGGVEIYYTHGRHNTTIGGELRSVHLDRAHSANPRGTFFFDGASSGDDLADFLLGVPHASVLSFSGSDRSLAAPAVSAYVSDDYRVGANLSVNFGLRWDYEQPFTERDGELVNLDLTGGYAASAPVTPASPVGPLSGRHFSDGLLGRDYTGFQPRVGVTWRPISGSSLVIRTGYGGYRASGAYGRIAEAMTEQPPFVNAVTVTQGHPTSTLADVFAVAPESTVRFAVAPDLGAPYAHHWQLSVQRDLPALLTAIVTYSGMRAVSLLQQSLPNISAPGVAPCLSCPRGFVYLSSSGHASREAAQFMLRRRLRRGFTASAQYTLSQSLDDTSSVTAPTGALAPTVAAGADVAGPSGLAGISIVQDWTNPSADWGPSSFDQRHVLRVQVEYSSGGGAAGLVGGRRGSLLNGWAAAAQLTVGSGLPFTPVFPVAIDGFGTLLVRPDVVGPSGSLSSDVYADATAYAIPPSGHWGNAGRGSIRGPAQFSLDGSLGRDIPLHGRNLEVRLNATNLLNRVTFGRVTTIVGSPQFGHPTLVMPMRKLQISVRVRY